MFVHFRVRVGAVLAVAVLVALSACAPPPGVVGAAAVAVEAAPVSGAATADTAGSLWPGYRVTSTVRFDSAPQAVGGTFIGAVFPDSGRPELSFYGVNATGAVWQVDTNPSCVGTVRTRVGANGQEPVTRTVATAFSAADGQVLWGPVQVPGPSAGDGLIFADTPKALTLERTPGTLLRAGTGAVVKAGPPGMPLYEYRGIALIGGTEQFAALDTDSGSVRWTEETVIRPQGVPDDARPRFEGAYGPATGGAVVLEWDTPQRHRTPVLHDLATGQPLVELPGEAAGEAVVDEETGTVLLVSQLPGGAPVVTAVQPGGEVLWQLESTQQIRVSAVGAGMVFADLGGQPTRIDLSTGAVLQSGDFVLPEAVLPDGTALFPTTDGTVYALAVIGRT